MKTNDSHAHIPHPADKVRARMIFTNPSTTTGFTWLLAYLECGCIEGADRPTRTSMIDEVLRIKGWTDAQRIDSPEVLSSSPWFPRKTSTEHA